MAAPPAVLARLCAYASAVPATGLKPRESSILPFFASLATPPFPCAGATRPIRPRLPRRLVADWSLPGGGCGLWRGAWLVAGKAAVMAVPALRAVLLLLAAVVGAAGEPCPEPTIVPSYYTTSDAVIASESVFVVEISLACRNGAQNVALYADVNGKQFPVTRGQDVGRYQVSWSLEHRNAHSGTYEVKFFDEESYSALRKAQRNNEDVSRIRPLFTVSVDHRGAWTGPWVSTEVVAAAIGLGVYYLAFSTKSGIQA
ncbi:translocon-associated protein subunit delta [Cuculus canorus]|uniref:translocon-associated protein subunit delta n=1 Tax=Cuculus canorus TaxID=55661 RepID=UPI0023AA94F7|nr:translocon-associated protein subunit delta [Cuculus canorus]